MSTYRSAVTVTPAPSKNRDPKRQKIQQYNKRYHVGYEVTFHIGAVDFLLSKSENSASSHTQARNVHNGFLKRSKIM
ncbi:unnamed protein product [Acanthoscelides obtectus]|uniref:Uncharacterized protein n=1 Tax=Acanthoscelides obtectus TaxID=200917 RepID=A0A9P0PYP2_ACAOB|nr:unnamed protein product [Acanthoscelides obtectus]CAK1651875.1 hypothetical protein AOBTE_LOCUS17510 [Acanthoscelides obtectus]